MTGTAGTVAALEKRCKDCGAPATKLCSRCAAYRAELRQIKNQVIVGQGHCPLCGAKLIANPAIAGWWLCAASLPPEQRDPELLDRAQCQFELMLD